MKESEIQRAILDYLASKGILAFRQNTGAMAGEYNGKKRFMRFGVPGMADILAFVPVHTGGWRATQPHKMLPGEKYYFGDEITYSQPLWIEVKTETGKQSEIQRSFQAQVEAHGHRYILARCVEDVAAEVGRARPPSSLFDFASIWIIR